MKMYLPPVSQIIGVLLKHSDDPVFQAAQPLEIPLQRGKCPSSSLGNACVLPEGAQYVEI